MSLSTPSSSDTSISESMAETRRRQRATVTGGESTLDDDSGYTRAFQTEDQKVLLWNLANVNLHPRSLYPAFRLLGLFPDTQTALAHASQVMATDTTCSLRMVETHSWYTIPRDEVTEATSDRAYVDKVNRNLLRHQEMLQDHASEFKARHDSLTKGRTPALEQAKAAQEQAQRDEMAREKRKAIYKAAVDQDEPTVERLKQKFESEMEEGAKKEMSAQMALALKKEGVVETKGEEEEEEEEEKEDAEYVEPKLVAPVAPETLNEGWDEKLKHVGGTVSPPSVSRMVEVRNQRYAVVSVVNDYETNTPTNSLGEEPGVIVWAAFDTEAEALRYNKCVASKQVRDHDLAIVSMYEWLYPHMMNSDRVEQLYRNEELNNIMRHARTSSKQVRDFEDMCEREEIDTPTLTIEPDLSEPAPRQWIPPVGSDLDDQSLAK